MKEDINLGGQLAEGSAGTWGEIVGWFDQNTMCTFVKFSKNNFNLIVLLKIREYLSVEYNK